MRILLIGILIVSMTVAVGWCEPRSAQELFQSNCQTCHGQDGKGNGPAAAVLQVQPRDLTQRPYRFGCGPGAVASTIKNGIAESGMPSFKETLTEDEVWKLADYVRRLQSGRCE